MGNESSLVLRGRLTVLRPFASGDISDTYLSWLNDPEIMQFSNQRFFCHTRKRASDYLQSFAGLDNLFLGICLREGEKLVGTMTAYRSRPHLTADMGILIGDRTCWGKGIGLDAWSTLMGYLFNVCKLRKVTGGTLASNVGMVRIMERSGMVLEAVRKEQELVAGVPQDALYYARFRAA